MAPFLLPPGTPDHLLLSGEAEGTTYTITTLLSSSFFTHHRVTEQSRHPTRLYGSKKTYLSVNL